MTVAPARALAETIVRVGQLARVPSARLADFGHLAGSVIERVRAGGATPDQAFLDDRSAIEGLRRPMIELRARLEQLEARPEAAAIIEWALAGRGGNVGQLIQWLRALDNLAVGQRHGRPVRASWLRHLVEQLEFAALQAGGDFTIGKRDEGGSIVAALEELRPHLPRGVLRLPGTHPLSSYGRILNGARSAWAPLRASWEAALTRAGSAAGARDLMQSAVSAELDRSGCRSIAAGGPQVGGLMALAGG